MQTETYLLYLETMTKLIGTQTIKRVIYGYSFYRIFDLNLNRFGLMIFCL